MNDTTSIYRCTLTPDGAKNRADTDRALAERVRSTERLERGVRVTFDAGEDSRELVDTFVDNERRCCGFFGFEIREKPGRLTLEITAPAAERAQALVDAAKETFDRGAAAVQPRSS